jgi:hypothetical protein
LRFAADLRPLGQLVDREERAGDEEERRDDVLVT